VEIPARGPLMKHARGIWVSPAGIPALACLRSGCAWRATGEIHWVTGWRKNGCLFKLMRLYAVRRRAIIKHERAFRRGRPPAS